MDQSWQAALSGKNDLESLAFSAHNYQSASSDSLYSPKSISMPSDMCSDLATFLSNLHLPDISFGWKRNTKNVQALSRLTCILWFD